MHKLIATVNNATEERRSMLQDKKHLCSQDADQKSESPQKTKLDETLRECEIGSSDWISERLYQMSNRDSSPEEDEDEDLEAS